MAESLGISHPALLRAEKCGRVPKRSDDGKWDVEECSAAMARNSNPTMSKYGRMQQNRKPDQPPEPELEDYTPLDDSLAEANRLLEWEKIRALKQKTDRDAGLLVEVAEVNAFVAGMIMKARDDLSRIGSEVADRLAQEVSPAGCRRVVEDRIFQVLESLREFTASV